MNSRYRNALERFELLLRRLEDSDRQTREDSGSIGEVTGREAMRTNSIKSEMLALVRSLIRY